MIAPEDFSQLEQESLRKTGISKEEAAAQLNKLEFDRITSARHALGGSLTMWVSMLHRVEQLEKAGKS